MNELKKCCNTCRWCTEKDFEDQKGTCKEPHAPRDARGEITSRTNLWAMGCRSYEPAPIEESSKEVTSVVREAAKKKGRPKKPVQREDMVV